MFLRITLHSNNSREHPPKKKKDAHQGITFFGSKNKSIAGIIYLQYVILNNLKPIFYAITA